MMSKLTELLKRWESDEGKPYKGSLIDWESFNSNNDNANLDCMCAQGQVLHHIGGKAPEWLKNIDQRVADKETAELLNISIAHAILLRSVNDGADGAPGIVLTAPEKVLGADAKTLLAFWLHLDRMTKEQWCATWAATWGAAWYAAWYAAKDDAGYAAREAAGYAAKDVAGYAAGYATWGAGGDAARYTAGSAARYACAEIQGVQIMRERGQPFYFLPMFGFTSPDEIPLLPADYGLVK